MRGSLVKQACRKARDELKRHVNYGTVKMPTVCPDIHHLPRFEKSSLLMLSHRHFLPPAKSNLASSPSLFMKKSFSGHLHASSQTASIASSSASGAVVHSMAQPSPASSISLSQLFKSLQNYSQCYYELSKTKLSLLVMTTASAGYVLGSGDIVDWKGLGWTSLGTVLAAASANTFNQVMEVTNDKLMKRTAGRPLPSGRISKAHALAWAMASGVSGIAILSSKVNDTAASLGAANIILYAGLYTPLKQMHLVNTWVGAVVGAIPPLMGWAGASGGSLDPGSWVLAGALFFWQIPHFMALAWMCRADYAKGGYVMMSTVDATGRRVAAAALRNCFYLAPIGFIATTWGVTSNAFAYENLLLAGAMGAASWSFYRNPTNATSRHLFRSSLVYLPFAMTAMVIHRKPFTSDSPMKPTITQPLQLISRGTDEEIRKQSAQLKKDLYTTTLLKEEQPLPPIAFYSVAPFPFLPVPQY